MAFYQFRRQQTLPTHLDKLWAFISKPENLKRITPPWMGFDITSDPSPESFYPGMVITYKVSPLPGIRMNWVTEITHIKEKLYFIDQQRMGPYTMWHHQHWLKPVAEGVQMDDIVSYQPPFGPLGAIANRLVIDRRLQQIFDYRQQIMESEFGSIVQLNGTDAPAPFLRTVIK